MLLARQAIPAKEKKADEGRFQEEGHQTFDGQRCAENITDVVGVVGPVGSELEFQGDTSGDAQCEVDPVQLAPEAGHVFVDGFAGHYINRFHDHQNPGHADC